MALPTEQKIMKLFKYAVYIGSVMLALSVLSKPSLAQSVAHSDKYAWTRLKWSGDDRPYLQAEQAINRQLGSSRNGGEDVIERYHTDATKLPKDKIAVYRWAYAAYSSITPSTPMVVGYQRTEPILDVMLATPAPYTHRYMRLMYLIGPKNYKLRWLGEKLLRADPNDLSLVYAQVHVLTNVIAYHYDRKIQNQALTYAHELLKREPNRAAYWGALGQVYSPTSVALKDNPAGVQLAIAAFRKELSLLGSHDERRPFVEGQLRSVENWQKYGHW